MVLAPVRPSGWAGLPSVVGVAGPSLLTPNPGGVALRLAVIGALLGLGLAGLAQLPLEPPLWGPAGSQPGSSSTTSPLPTPLSTPIATAAAGSATASEAPGPPAAGADLLADLDRQDALQDGRQRATVLLSSFVGAEITRFFWGGFSGYLDVLGLEPPEDMAVALTLPASPAAGVQLELTPRQGGERYIARVVAAGSVPHGIACRGGGPVGAFRLRDDHLLCPPGWQEMPFKRAHR